MRNYLSFLVLAVLMGGHPPLEAARPDAFNRPFVEVPPTHLQEFLAKDFPVLRRTQQYPLLRLPKAPIFHPYHIHDDNLREDKAGLLVLYNFKLPDDFQEALPARLQARLAAQGLAGDQVDIFWVVQDMPWTGSPILFRPHYWCDPAAPASGHFSHPFSIMVGLFDAPPGVLFDGQADGDAFFRSDIQVHGPNAGVGPIVSSPNNLPVTGLNHDRTVTFWTLTQMGNRAAATLHVLLNDTDQALLMSLSPYANTLRELVARLEGSDLQGTPMVEKFKQLTRPIITGQAGKSTQLGAPQAELTLTGSGFQGTTAVSVEGQPAPFREESDSRLVLTVPSAAMQSRNLRVTTPMGESLPFHPLNADGPAPAVLGAHPNLWQREGHRLLTVAGDGNAAGEYQTLPCVPGDVFEGTCVVWTHGMHSGVAQLGMRFTCAGEIPTYTYHGAAQGLSQIPADLFVRGVAPAGATEVQLYIQACQANPGARAVFNQVTFHKRPSPAVEAVAVPLPSPQPAMPGPAALGLWQKGSGHTLTVAGNGGTHGVYQVIPCVPGEVLEGTCYVRTEGMDYGKAQINLQFSRGGADPTYGAAGSPGLPLASRGRNRVGLSVRGTVPEGATQVMLYIQANGANAGASAIFDTITFRRAVNPSESASQEVSPAAPTTGAMHPSEAVHASPNLWLQGPDHALTVACNGGSQGVYQVMPCAPGDVLEGMCNARTEGLNDGHAQINLQFSRGGANPTYGVAGSPGRPLATRDPNRVGLSVRGRAPEGATQVMLYIQAHHTNAGARAIFDTVTFARTANPSGSVSQVVPPPATATAEPSQTEEELAAMATAVASMQARSASAQAGHQAAMTMLEQNMAANHCFSSFSGPYQHPMEMSLADECHRGAAVSTEFATKSHRPETFKINYDYLRADPYLAYHNTDIDQLIPNEVTDQQMVQIIITLHTTGQDHEHVLSGIFATVDATVPRTKARLRKRMLRMFNEAQRRTVAEQASSQGEREARQREGRLTPMADLTFRLAANAGRCPDGLQRGFGDIESWMFPINSVQGEDHLGVFISKVLTDYKMDFIEKHGQFRGPSTEFATTVPQSLRQKMLYSMGLRGHFEALLYLGFGDEDPQFDSERVMRRFLEGERGMRVASSSICLDFEAYNVDKMIGLLQEARERAMLSPNGSRPLYPDRTGLKLDFARIKAECVNPVTYAPMDPVLGPAWNTFEVEEMLATANEYFLPANPGEFDTNIRLTRAFWLHVLKVYKYIVLEP